MPEVVDGLKVGTWPITQERRDYVDGSLELYIPAIGITRTIWDGTDAQTLSKGVGLYEYAQLPGEGNRNVSLAGHRNGLDKNGNVTDHAPFYYVDTLGRGTISTSPAAAASTAISTTTPGWWSPTTGAPSPPRAIAA